jgi:exonuclease SbcD
MKIIHFADLHLGVENYGQINPETGLSSRLEDFLKALDQLVDYALENKIDLVLFCGDAYKTREPSQTQQREFARRIKRLSAGGIPFFLLIGNHDLPNAIGRATTMEIFDTLSVPNVQVANRPGIYKIATKSGEIQIAALPWVRRSALLSREDTRNMDFTQINQRLQDVLTGIIADQTTKLDPNLPSILAAHIWVMNATLGSEKGMSIGQEHMLLLSSVAQPAFDYVALGHIHKGQVLKIDPPTIYSGSLERLDFGDEEIEKGFYVVDIETDKLSGKRKTSYQFQPINARRFFTLKVDIQAEDLDPTNTVIQAIEANQEKIKDAVTRLEIKLPAAISSKLRDNDIRNKIKDSYYLTVAKEIQRENRSRLGRSALEGVTPVDALRAYLETKHTPERAKLLLEYGEKLIQNRS